MKASHPLNNTCLARVRSKKSKNVNGMATVKSSKGEVVVRQAHLPLLCFCCGELLSIERRRRKKAVRHNSYPRGCRGSNAVEEKSERKKVRLNIRGRQGPRGSQSPHLSQSHHQPEDGDKTPACVGWAFSEPSARHQNAPVPFSSPCPDLEQSEGRRQFPG